ncbi:MAG TPA: YeeE/YedE thiosulfate transporter family protein [Planctomycetaceae bacterium]
MFDSPAKLALGLLTGIAFGFLLQKGRVAKYDVILGQLLLKDWTVAKIMGTAVAVGSVGVYALVEGGWASLHVRPLLLGGVLAGAVLFGIGMALLGYCPGTSVAACGEGRRDAMVGVLGMLAGAAAYVALYPTLQPLAKAFGDRGKVTLPELWDVSPWLLVAALVVAFLLLAWSAGRSLTSLGGTRRAT